MKIKRAFYAMLVLLLLPLTAMAQAPTIPTPAVGTAVIAVSKYFDNPAGGYFSDIDIPITVRIQCDGGSIAPNNAQILTTNNGEEYVTSFVVYNLGPGQTTACTVWEEEIDGYTPVYWSDGIPTSEVCEFAEISANTVDGGLPSEGSQGICQISNEVDPVEVEVTKVWEVFGQPGANFSEGATITIYCDAYISGWTSYFNGYYYKTFEIGNHQYVDGVADVSADVYPEWYANDDTTTCHAYESNVSSAVETDDTDCDNLSVAIGSSGVGCTITNTVFFEGIPTLNQYGMAILALLMLGVGFVGFRRFV